MPHGAVARDLRLLLVVQALRAFAYGAGSVLIGSALAASGRSGLQAGAVFAAMLAGSSVASLLVGLRAERVGRRRLYRSLLALMGAAGATFALTEATPLLLLAALTGTLSTDPNESGPITSLEQAMIAEAPRAARIRTFGRYNAVAYLAGAAGSLLAGVPAALREADPAVPPDRWWLLLFPVVAAASVGVAGRLSPRVEASGSPAGAARPLGSSRSTVARLASLFALDAFAGGFVVQAFLAYWLRRRYGVGADALGPVFSAAGLLQAASSLAAARLGGRFGLLRTMVLTHLPSNGLLALVPLAPTYGWAVALLLARSTLSQMDVPTRQAYLAALVPSGERTAAAAFTNTARSLARPAGPLLAGWLMRTFGVGAPLLAAGGLKTVYDALLWLSFRGVRLPEEPLVPRAARPGPG